MASYRSNALLMLCQTSTSHCWLDFFSLVHIHTAIRLLNLVINGFSFGMLEAVAQKTEVENFVLRQLDCVVCIMSGWMYWWKTKLSSACVEAVGYCFNTVRWLSLQNRWGTTHISDTSTDTNTVTDLADSMNMFLTFCVFVGKATYRLWAKRCIGL